MALTFYKFAHVCFFRFYFPKAITFFFHRHSHIRAYFLWDKMYILMVKFNIPYKVLGNQKKILCGVKWEKKM